MIVSVSRQNYRKIYISRSRKEQHRQSKPKINFGGTCKCVYYAPSIAYNLWKERKQRQILTN